MIVTKTKLDGVLILTPRVFEDERGFFMETYSKVKIPQINADFVQDNHSLSIDKGVLRGLHMQKGDYAQAKLVRCISGSILDVAVDLRKGSKTYKQWISITLSAQNKQQIFLPRGFAHGFLTLEKNTEIIYKTDNYYNKDSDTTILWNDEDLSIDWGIKTPILSEKDRNAAKLSDILL